MIQNTSCNFHAYNQYSKHDQRTALKAFATLPPLLAVLVFTISLVFCEPVKASTCNEFPDYAPSSLPLGAAAGFELETPEYCNKGIIPAGQKVVILNYNLSYGYVPGQNALYTYTLYVKINGIQVQTIAVETPVNENNFPGAPPFCSEDPLLPYCFHSKNFEVYMDVSAYTSAQAAQVEVFSAAHTSDQSVHAGVLFFGSLNFNFRFVLQQTNFSFQPRDSQDPISACAAEINTSNCYPTFQTTFMTLDSTLPLNSVGLFEVEPNVKVRFRLKFHKPHLKGTSSNNGNDLDPDYIINPSQNPLQGEADGQQFGPFLQTTLAEATQPDGSFMVETAPATLLMGTDPTPFATLKVTSRDFGGRARLFAEAVFGAPGNEVVVSAEVGEIIENLLIPAEVPACVSDERLRFATIPIDQDCDDIADSWEAEFGGVPSADYDAEPGPGGPHVGDGYTAHDECKR